MDIVTVWWLWLVLALLLAALEMVVPAFIFLGFAIGAAVTGGLLALDVIGASMPIVLVVFALISLGAWIALRLTMGVRKGQVRHFDEDINQ